MDKLLYSMKDGQVITSLGRTKFLELVRDGEIPTVRVGRRRMVTAQALRTFVDSLAEETG